MTFTIWELFQLGRLVGQIRQASIDEIQYMLDLRSKLELSDQQQQWVEQESEYLDQEVEIEVEEKEIKLFYNLVTNESVRWPIDVRVLQLKEKITRAKEVCDEQANGRSEKRGSESAVQPQDPAAD